MDHEETRRGFLENHRAFSTDFTLTRLFGSDQTRWNRSYDHIWKENCFGIITAISRSRDHLIFQLNGRLLRNCATEISHRDRIDGSVNHLVENGLKRTFF